MRVLGVPVRVDASWLLIAGLVGYVYVQAFADAVAPPSGGVLAFGALLAAAGFFVSLLAHELGHALTSRAMGIQVHGITLFLLGGVTESASEAKRPRDDFLIVALGPVLSGVAAAVFYGVARLDPPAPLDSVALFLAAGNLLLAVFNVLPGYPLDGGRLLRAVLWAITGRPHAATRWAARVGQGFAVLVIGLGVWMLATRGGFSGLWEVLLGGFLLRGAAQSHTRAAARERLAARRVRDVMGTAPPPLRPEFTLAEALERIQERPSLLWPVGEPLIGALTLERIDDVPDIRWHDVRVADVAIPPDGVQVAADAPLEQALEAMTGAPGGMLLVLDGPVVVGLLTPSLLGLGER